MRNTSGVIRINKQLDGVSFVFLCCFSAGIGLIPLETSVPVTPASLGKRKRFARNLRLTARAQLECRSTLRRRGLGRATVFLRLGLPSTLICHENEAFQKRCPNWRNFKTPALWCFSLNGKILKTDRSF